MDAEWLDSLNDRQREGATHSGGALLIMAGAGTGKTNTLAHRVAWLISHGDQSGAGPAADIHPSGGGGNDPPGGDDPGVGGEYRPAGGTAAERIWGGTFHAIANRLLRLHARQLGLARDIHGARSVRRGRSAQRSAERTGAGQGRRAVSAEGDVPVDLQPVRELRRSQSRRR